MTIIKAAAGLATGIFLTTCAVKETYQHQEKPPKSLLMEAQGPFLARCASSDQSAEQAVTLDALRRIARTDSCEAMYLGINELESLDLGFPLQDTSKAIDLSLLEFFPHLRNLTIRRFAVKDWSKLARFSNLRRLTLNDTHFSQMDVLRSLVQLEILDLSHNAVEDLNPIGQLRSLRELILSENQISSVEAISSLEDLKILDLSSNKITSAASLVSLHKLERLYLDHNPVEDYAFLKLMESLHSILYDVEDVSMIPEELRGKWVKIDKIP